MAVQDEREKDTISAPSKLYHCGQNCKLGITGLLKKKRKSQELEGFRTAVSVLSRKPAFAKRPAEMVVKLAFTKSSTAMAVCRQATPTSSTQAPALLPSLHSQEKIPQILTQQPQLNFQSPSYQGKKKVSPRSHSRIMKMGYPVHIHLLADQSLNWVLFIAQMFFYYL